MISAKVQIQQSLTELYFIHFTSIFLLTLLMEFDCFSDVHVAVALQFESGYFVETLVEGDKLGVTPHTIRVSPVEGGELLAVDAAHSNIVRITPPLSECMFFFRLTLRWFLLCFLPFLKPF
jgi:hypothetical protein